ncbi:MAG: glycosyltransferase family 39 protein [Anaerolineae bacterium]|nr:glycosyltransferase family 39 protein [Anaerolineae bacterium]
MLDNKRKHWWVLIPIFCFSLALVAPHLNADALWFDEFMTYYHSGGGEVQGVTLLQTLSRTAEDFAWPPGFYLIMTQWQQVSRGSLFVDRLMQTFTGLLTIAVLYQLGKSLFSRRVGIFSAILLATSAVFIFYMHELRGHVLYVLSVALCLWSYRLVLQDRTMKHRWRQIFFVLSLVFALYAHYVATAAIVAIGVYHLLFERTTTVSDNKEKTLSVERAKNWNRITFLGILSFGIYGPWMGILILSLVRRAVYFEAEVTSITSLPVWFYIFFNGILYFALLPLSLLSLRWIHNRSLHFLWLWTILTIVVSLITNIFTDFLFHPRHLLIMLIPICLTLAFVLDKIWQ